MGIIQIIISLIFRLKVYLKAPCLFSKLGNLLEDLLYLCNFNLKEDKFISLNHP